MRLKFFGFMLFWALPSFAQTNHDLKSVFELAKKNTAFVKGRTLSLEVAKQQKRQAISEILPTLTVNSTTTWRDQVNVGAFGESKQHTGAVNLSQPLFQGGSEYYALSIARRLPKIAKLNKQHAEIQLFTQVAEAFYQVFQLGRENQTLKEQEDTLRERVITLKKRARIGRNKKTDVLAARSQLARIRANRALNDNHLIEAQLSLQNLTGTTEELALVDFQKVENLTVPEVWEENLDKNPGLLATELALVNAEKEVSAATGNFLPSVSAEGNYYFDRAGILQDSEWDVTLTASWELLSGGSDYAERKIAKLEVERLRVQLTDQKRNLKNGFRNLKQAFLIKQKTVDKMKSAVDIAQANYKQHVREANQGLVSQLDALRTLEEYLQVRQAYEAQIYDAKLAYVKLKEIAGVQP